MPKFMGIDLLDSLERIMKKNTLSYQGDFSYDRKELEEVRVVYEKGEYYQEVDDRIRKEEHKIFGKFLHSEYVPSDSAALETVLWQEEQKRRNMRCGKIENHIRNIRRMAA